jgi:hypothetical protein
MPALVAGLHVLIAVQIGDVDGRDKPGHDVKSVSLTSSLGIDKVGLQKPFIPAQAGIQSDP